jgi:PAS domain S-box-containing protein
MQLGELATAPVYVLSDASMGTGAVGGSVASIEAFGRRAGEIARLILTGSPPQSLPFEVRTETVPMFDWRALERWGIAEERLPRGSVILHRPQSVWSQYSRYIGAALLIIAMQSALILALALQIRQRRRAQAELEESRNLMDLATDAGELGLWSRDLKTGAMWANAKLRSLFGLPPHQAMTFEAAFARVHPDDRQRVNAQIELAHAAEQPFQVEYRIELPDGTERWMLAQGRTVPDPQGAHARRVGVVFDITRRKRSEQSLDEQRTFLRQVIDVNPSFIFAKDREGRFTLANQAVADAYGVSVAALIGKTDADFNPNPEEVESFRRMDLHVMDTLNERFIPEERITDAQGEVRYLQTVKRPIIGADGKANQIIGASTDITRRKLAELALQEQRAELAHVERVSIMGELVASLMHEINQPLTAILSNAQAGLNYVTHEPLDVQELREVLVDIVADDKRAAEIIRGMRALAKKEASLNFERLDIPALVHDVVKLLHGDAALRGVSVEVDLDAIAPVRGHRIQLQQVLINLLLNAFDAVAQCSPAERRLRIGARRFDERTNVVSVSDCGPGLDQEALGRIFERFYSTKREGLGLGLAICRSIIVAHGGALWAQNNPGRGATFYFTVPLVQSHAVADLAASEQSH